MKKLSILLTCLLSSTVMSAELSSAKGVSVLYINGVPAESKLGTNTIEDGFNQIVVRMDKEVGRGSGNGVFTSKPYVVEINVSGDEVTIDHPTARSKKEAELAFRDDQPEWRIEQDGQPIEFQQEVLKGKKGMFPYLGMDKLITEHNQQRGIYFDKGMLIDKPVAAVSATAVTAAAVTDMPEAPQVAPQVVDTINLDQLKAWYLKSSTEERKAFRRWMIDQE
ncbi:DUF2057 domain-containing protein [Vibrio scophthalmi]|uniref:YccT family protein n=1 Tax=Vibrio scophthalmi TaxID=45658 RepID=UPI002FEF3F36